MKQLKVTLDTFAMAMCVVFSIAADAREDDTWFKENFTVVRTMEMESSAFAQQSLEVYRSNKSGNCYIIHGHNNRGGFSQVPCEDFVTDMDMLKEIERIEGKIAEQTALILERKAKLDEAIKRYEESLK
ncbi:hypothetical protein VPHD51_0174 [Vibrio phage D51]